MSKRSHTSNKHRSLGILCLISLSLCLWIGHLSLRIAPVEFGQAVTAQTPDTSQQVQQGIERYQAEDYQGAIALWETALNNYQNTKDPTNTTIILGNLAKAYQQVGQIDQAIDTWEKLIAYYRQIGNLQKVGRLLTEQAQAYIQQGKNRQAIAKLSSEEFALLCNSPTTECLPGTALAIARQQKDELTQVAALGTLGEAYRLRGKYDEAIHYLQDAQQLEHSPYQFSLLNSLGNTYLAIAQYWDGIAKSAQKNKAIIAKDFQDKARQNYQQSLEYFQNGLSLAHQQQDKVKQMQSLLNLIQVTHHSTRFNLTTQVALKQIIQETLTLLEQLPDSPLKVKAAIELAILPDQEAVIELTNLSDRTGEVTAPLAQCYSPRQLSDSQAQGLLNQAFKIAETINDNRSKSFSLGALGHFYECQKDDKKALELTQKALLNADQNLMNKDSLYLWEWQAGRIFRIQAQQLREQGKESEAQKKQLEAISAFQRAFGILEQIRSDILIAERDVQFDFRDTIEPVYRQLAQLRLRLAALLSADKQQKEELNQALNTIDSLRLAELQNYLGNDCFLPTINFEEIKQVIKNDTAILNSIILEDRVAIILTLPNRNPQVNWIEENNQIVDVKTVEAKIKQFREELVYGKSNLDYDPKTADTKTAKELYDWMIKPLELNSEPIKTLVFVQDGIFRTIPMAALYDGQQFLIEKYAIAITPSLQFINPQKFNPKESRALILGLTKETQVDEQEFQALDNISSEIQEVQNQFPNNKLLLDEQFNQANLKKELNQANYQIVHVGTHAQFGFIPEETFLVTGDNNKITIKELETSFRQLNGGANSIELLTLTACQTAAGDERAALGLAGVAIQTGAKSALASLWSVDDESTVKLVAEFYNSLVKNGVSKAEALQTAQLKLIKAKEFADINDKYGNPAYWAPFILIGNWL